MNQCGAGEGSSVRLSFGRGQTSSNLSSDTGSMIRAVVGQRSWRAALAPELPCSRATNRNSEMGSTRNADIDFHTQPLPVGSDLFSSCAFRGVQLSTANVDVEGPEIYVDPYHGSRAAPKSPPASSPSILHLLASDLFRSLLIPDDLNSDSVGSSNNSGSPGRIEALGFTDG